MGFARADGRTGSDTVLNGKSFCPVMRIKGPVSVDHAIDQMC